MRLIIIPVDGLISIDGQCISKIQHDMSWIPENIHAIQWYETWGEIEYTDGSPNEKIEELGIYEQAVDTFNNEKQRLEDEKIAQSEAIEAARDYWAELRYLRDLKLSESDWTQIKDVPLTEEQKTAWATYRQALRDVPANTEDPKNPVWPVAP